LTSFQKDTIVFDAKPASKVALPTSSRQKVVFLDTDNKLKTLDFDGKLELLGGKEEVTFIKAPESGLFYSSQTHKYYRNENGQLLEVDGTGVEGDPTQVAEIYETTFELPQGPAGRDGVDGLPGKDGKDGVDGKDGKNGKDGVDGKDGKNGKDGRDGIGIQGVPGKDGRDGVDGKDGLPGRAGPAGGGVSRATVIRLINEYSPSGEVSKSFGYNVDDQLVLISDSKGTQTFSYTDGLLTGIVGTGSYISKDFTYDIDDKLTGITIL